MPDCLDPLAGACVFCSAHKNNNKIETFLLSTYPFQCQWSLALCSWRQKTSFVNLSIPMYQHQLSFLSTSRQPFGLHWRLVTLSIPWSWKDVICGDIGLLQASSHQADSMATYQTVLMSMNFPVRFPTNIFVFRRKSTGDGGFSW